MGIIMWTALLVVLIARSSIAVVTKVNINIDPSIVVENNTVTFTCSGECNNGTCKAEPSSGSRANVKRDGDKTFKCTVTDTGDNTTLSGSKTFVVHYGPDTKNAGIYSNNKTAESTLKVIKAEKLQHSIECRRGECSKCTMSWKRPHSPDTLTNAKTLPLFDSNTVMWIQHAGTYTCRAFNEITRILWEKKLTIIVQYAPEVSLTWNENTKTLKCKAEGVPATYRNTKIVQTAGHSTHVRTFNKTMRNGVATLSFSNPTYQDTGNYTCTTENGITSEGAMNKPGHNYTIFEDKPVLVMSEDSYNVSKGAQLAMVVLLYAIPEEISITLYDPENNNIPTTTTFETSNVHTNFYNVRVTVPGIHLTVQIGEVLESYFNATLNLLIANNEGNVHTTVILFPEGAPDIPGNLSLTEITHDMVKFSMVTGFFNGAPQTLVLEYRKPGNISEWNNETTKEAGEEKNITFQLNINNLEPEAAYEFRAYSYNEYARSNYTTVITETMRPTPLPLGIIIGVTVSVVAITIIVIIILVIVKKRRQGSHTQKERPKVYENTGPFGSIPVSPRFEDNQYSAEPMTRDSADRDTCDQTYINTQIGPSKQIEVQAEKPTSRQESAIYQNTQLSTFGERKNGGNTLSANDAGKTMAPYLELQGSGEKVEEAYLTMTVVKGLAQTPKLNTKSKQESLDNGYLDMKGLMAAKLQNSTPERSDMQLSNQKVKKQKERMKNTNLDYVDHDENFGTLDYENVTKKMAAPSAAQKPRNTPRFGRGDSVPEHIAPPPPNALDEENHYANLRLKP